MNETLKNVFGPALPQHSLSYKSRFSYEIIEISKNIGFHIFQLHYCEVSSLNSQYFCCMKTQRSYCLSSVKI